MSPTPPHWLPLSLACSTSDELWWWTGYKTSLLRRCGSLFMHVHIYGMSYMCLPAPLALFSGPAQLSVTCSILTSRRALPCLSVNWHKLECTS